MANNNTIAYKHSLFQPPLMTILKTPMPSSLSSKWFKRAKPTRSAQSSNILDASESCAETLIDLEVDFPANNKEEGDTQLKGAASDEPVPIAHEIMVAMIQEYLRLSGRKDVYDVLLKEVGCSYEHLLGKEGNGMESNRNHLTDSCLLPAFHEGMTALNALNNSSRNHNGIGSNRNSSSCSIENSTTAGEANSTVHVHDLHRYSAVPLQSCSPSEAVRRVLFHVADRCGLELRAISNGELEDEIGWVFDLCAATHVLWTSPSDLLDLLEMYVSECEADAMLFHQHAHSPPSGPSSSVQNSSVYHLSRLQTYGGRLGALLQLLRQWVNEIPSDFMHLRVFRAANSLLKSMEKSVCTVIGSVKRSHGSALNPDQRSVLSPRFPEAFERLSLEGGAEALSLRLSEWKTAFLDAKDSLLQHLGMIKSHTSAISPDPTLRGSTVTSASSLGSANRSTSGGASGSLQLPGLDDVTSHSWVPPSATSRLDAFEPGSFSMALTYLCSKRLTCGPYSVNRRHFVAYCVPGSGCGSEAVMERNRVGEWLAIMNGLSAWITNSCTLPISDSGVLSPARNTLSAEQLEWIVDSLAWSVSVASNLRSLRNYSCSAAIIRGIDKALFALNPLLHAASLSLSVSVSPHHSSASSGMTAQLRRCKDVQSRVSAMKQQLLEPSHLFFREELQKRLDAPHIAELEHAVSDAVRTLEKVSTVVYGGGVTGAERRGIDFSFLWALRGPLKTFEEMLRCAVDVQPMLEKYKLQVHRSSTTTTTAANAANTNGPSTPRSAQVIGLATARRTKEWALCQQLLGAYYS